MLTTNADLLSRRDAQASEADRKLGALRNLESNLSEGDPSEERS